MTEQRKHLCLEGTVFRLLRSPQPSIGCFFLRKKRAVSSAGAGILISLYGGGEGGAYTGGEVQGGIAQSSVISVSVISADLATGQLLDCIILTAH
jgi:hypothetical protein